MLLAWVACLLYVNLLCLLCLCAVLLCACCARATHCDALRGGVLFGDFLCGAVLHGPVHRHTALRGCWGAFLPVRCGFVRYVVVHLLFSLPHLHHHSHSVRQKSKRKCTVVDTQQEECTGSSKVLSGTAGLGKSEAAALEGEHWTDLLRFNLRQRGQNRLQTDSSKGSGRVPRGLAGASTTGVCRHRVLCLLPLLPRWFFVLWSTFLVGSALMEGHILTL